MVDSRKLNFSRACALFKGRVFSATQVLNSRGLVAPSSSTKMAENLFLLRLFYAHPVTKYFGELWKKLSKNKNALRISLPLHDPLRANFFLSMHVTSCF